MNRLRITFILFTMTLFSCKVTKVSSEPKVLLHYELGMSNPSSHYLEVKMKIDNVNQVVKNEKLYVQMPVWTPGSYLVREFAKNVHGFSVVSGDKPLKFKKINKNTWEIDLDQSLEATISYKVYAYEMSVRTSFLDDSHAYLNGASVFMYLPGFEKTAADLTVMPYKDWTNISTALVSIGKNKYKVPDFDTLVDSPIEIGTHEVLKFESMGIPHEVAMYSMEPLKYDKDKLLGDYKKMTQAATTVIGENPLDHYLFINHHLPNVGGGLEHLYSTTCQTSPNTYQNRDTYIGFFSTLAHEYFHLWNVKRIRPEALGPFDYTKENYTHMLWVAEGFTSYYEEIILKRAGLIDENEVLKAWAGGISGVENTPGNAIQPVTESSWDAWIKYYRPNEDSKNTTISYYSKGGVLAGLLNIEILSASKGEKSLDDVMRYLWNEYYKKLQRGYTDDEFQAACEHLAGVSLNDFFSNYVWDTQTPYYKSIYDKAGMELKITPNEGLFLGITAGPNNSIRSLTSNGAAYKAGLNAGDVITKINGTKLEYIDQIIEGRKLNDVVKVSVIRAGVEKEFDIKLIADPRNTYQLIKLEKQNSHQKKIYDFLMYNK